LKLWDVNGKQQKLEDLDTYTRTCIVEDHPIRDNLVGGGKKAKKKRNTNVGILMGVFKLRQNKTTQNQKKKNKKTKKQKNKQTSRISADWPRIYFYSCE
jgi:hypothetical protein